MAQVIRDDFNDRDDAGWTRYDPLGSIGYPPATFTFPSGGYEIASDPPPNFTYGPARAGSFREDLTCTDFSVSADLVDWDNSQAQVIGLFARAGALGIGTTTGYLFHYNVGDTDIGIISVSGEVPGDAVYLDTESIDPNGFTVYFDFSTLGINEGEVLKATITTERSDGVTRSIVRYFTTDGEIGTLRNEVAFFMALFLMIFGLTLVGARSTFSWWGIFICLAAAFILSFAIGIWWVNLLFVVDIIIIIFSVIMLLKLNYVTVV